MNGLWHVADGCLFNAFTPIKNMFRFEKLEIWKLAIGYANDIYDLTDKFPNSEKYNVTDQLKRASLSISNNIAEGSGAATKKNFCSYLDISVSSAFETVNLLHFAKMRNYITESTREALYNKAEVLIKKIRSFKKSLKSP
jgi:four helix bundle protein